MARGPDPFEHVLQLASLTVDADMARIVKSSPAAKDTKTTSGKQIYESIVSRSGDVTMTTVPLKGAPTKPSAAAKTSKVSEPKRVSGSQCPLRWLGACEGKGACRISCGLGRVRSLQPVRDLNADVEEWGHLVTLAGGRHLACGALGTGVVIHSVWLVSSQTFRGAENLRRFRSEKPCKSPYSRRTHAFVSVFSVDRSLVAYFMGDAAPIGPVTVEIRAAFMTASKFTWKQDDDNGTLLPFLKGKVPRHTVDLEPVCGFFPVRLFTPRLDQPVVEAKAKGPAPAEEDDEPPLEDANDGIDAKWSLEEKPLGLKGERVVLLDSKHCARCPQPDAFDSCIAKSAGLQLMMDAIMQAAKPLGPRMEYENWLRFRDIPLPPGLLEIEAIHSNLFAQTAPEQLSDFLTKLGWTGVCVGPFKPPKGNEDCLQYVNIDPADAEDQKRMDDLLNDTGGLIPKPDMEMIDPHDEDYEEKLQARQEEKKNRKPEVQVPGERLENAPLPPLPPMTSSGYGVVGLTRNERVRRRLRALRNCLNVALGRLTKDGSLVLLWPGLPVHPVLFFIAGVWDIVLQGGLELRSFFDSTWRPLDPESTPDPFKHLQLGPRLDALDDVLLWTLPPDQEEEETSVAITGKGIVAAYTLLWKTWATMKLSSLALDLGMLLGQVGGAPAKAPVRALLGALEPPMPAAEPPPESPEPSKADASDPTPAAEPAAVAPAESAAEATAPATSEPGVPAAADTQKDAEAEKTTEEPAGNSTSAEDQKEKPTVSKPGHVRRRAPPGTRVSPLKDTHRSASSEPRPPRKRFSLNRGVPSMSCTFGAAPGTKHKETSYEELAKEYRLVHKALEVAKRGRQKHWDLDEDAAGRAVTGDAMAKTNSVTMTEPVTKTDSLEKKMDKAAEAAEGLEDASATNAGEVPAGAEVSAGVE
ncbi:KCNB2 [Symbiodinium natans]|uniref:KCNB2 protein n=1 Tax=Symbiodinium natans TaxID=878477 RepID=A0A812JYD9_9DINO|nr:KCNB2 [Symbiodinium natans]